MKTQFGIEIELVREDWQESGWRSRNTPFCRCGYPRLCKRKLHEVPLFDDLPDGWVLEGDCSIPPPPHGVELVSPRLTMDQLLPQLNEALLACAHHGYGAGPAEFCGTHLSIGNQGPIGQRIRKRAENTSRLRESFMCVFNDTLTRINSGCVHFQDRAGYGKRHAVNIGSTRVEFRHFKSCSDFSELRKSILTLVYQSRHEEGKRIPV